MNHRFTARLGALARTRGVLGLLTVLTLNAVVLPCAMAFGLDDNDCAHCPPSEQHEMAGHHGHAQAAASPCADVQSECCDVASASVDSRSGKLKVRDAGDAAAVPLPATPVESQYVTHRAEPPPRPPDFPGAFPPLHKINCVYLD